MIAYFKKYTIFVCIIAVALPVVVSTVWPLMTGQMMASTLPGLVGMFVLFIFGLLVAYAIFEKKAEKTVDGYLAQYNDACDPEAFLDRATWLYEAMSFPCNQISSWFLGYYAQALLELGRVEEARAIGVGLRQSAYATRKPAAKAAILANLVPLAEKLDDAAVVEGIVSDGLEYCAQDGGSKTVELREFFANQQKVFAVRTTEDQAAIANMAETIRSNAAYPARIRVEYAWEEAGALYKTGDVSEERRCLAFVVEKGNKLALATRARERLASISA